MKILAACCLALILPAATASAQNRPVQDPRWQPLINQSIAPEPSLGGTVPHKGKRSMQVQFSVAPRDLPRLLSTKLSTACALGRFNQVEHDRYYIRMNDADGKPLRLGLAGAKAGNLRDPDGMSMSTQLYLFDKDWTSECKVYAAQAPQ